MKIGRGRKGWRGGAREDRGRRGGRTKERTLKLVVGEGSEGSAREKDTENQLSFEKRVRDGEEEEESKQTAKCSSKVTSLDVRSQLDSP